MPLPEHARLGSYEIIALLGMGGMGEVYQARDTKLGRAVAIKVLPDALASDADRITRFEREAKALAALNHPHIATLFEVAESDGRHLLVMEMVEGDTLADHLQHGSLPVASALQIALQIADALEAAHERGIVHRDLKPANIKITPDGKVKVLDFGLAKILDAEPATSSSAISLSPTMSVRATYAGVILGTAAYMAPEQARGKTVDRRADIWAFGCILFEMLTGRQTFEGGETVSDAIAAILKNDPDWSALPADTPPHVRRLLRRCLHKDPRKRLPHIGAARVEIEDGDSGTPAVVSAAPAASDRRSVWIRTAAIGGTLLAAGVAIGALLPRRSSAPSSPAARFTISLPAAQRFSSTARRNIAISPDGASIAYIANSRLYVRAIGDFQAHAIPGTENVQGTIYHPLFSPDSRTVAFFVGQPDRALKRVPITGGTPVTICSGDVPLSASWTGGDILFTQGDGGGVLRVRAVGGTPEPLIRSTDGRAIGNAEMLPDGSHVLLSLAGVEEGNRWDHGTIVAQSLATGERTVVIEGGTDGHYLPTGHVVYMAGGVLFAVPYDVSTLRTTGTPVSVVEGVRRSTAVAITAGSAGAGGTWFGVSSNGTLVYVPGNTSAATVSDLAIIDRDGLAHPLKLPQNTYEFPRISPDGRRIAFGTQDARESSIWVYDLSGSSSARRLTLAGRNRYPLWAPDGERVVFQSDREGDGGLFWQRADGIGAAQRLTTAENGAAHVPDTWSRDGTVLVFESMRRATGPDSLTPVLPNRANLPNALFSLWMLTPRDGRTALLGRIRSAFPINAAISPDGRWMAYSSTESGAAAIYIEHFPPDATRFQLPKDDVFHYHHPAWSPDGREMFFIPGPGRLSSVALSTTSSVSFSPQMSIPRSFNEIGPGTPRTFDILPDGRFIGVIDASRDGAPSASEQQIDIVLNWFEELKQRAPSR